MTLNIKCTALALSLLGAFSAAQATPLLVESSTTNVDYSPTSFGGTLRALAMSYISNSSYSGTARAAVYDTGTGLDFYYQFSSNPSSVNGVARFTGFNFSNLGVNAVDVYQTDSAFGIFTVGTEMAANADRTNLGVIGFNFVPENGLSKVNPGTTSFTQIIRTNARFYQEGNFGLLNGVGDNAVAFATAVPEPESYALMLAGLGLMGTIVGRRNKSHKNKLNSSN